MAIALGKRKRQVADTQKPRPKPAPKTEEGESDGEDLQAIFRRAFEAKFKPLSGTAEKKAAAVQALEDEDEDGDTEEDVDDEEDAENNEDDSAEEDEWAGVSEPEDEIEVVEHADIRRIPREELDRKQMKAFMSAKPPSSDLASTTAKVAPTKAKDDLSTEDDGTDSANLKNDLALQRLLNESHLLDSSFSSTDPSGKNRHRATDLRLLSLGSKGSILEQKNMPLSHRKGIAAKKEQKEFDRRREAKENGIILERAAMAKRGGAAGASSRGGEKRTRAIAGPSVGRFSGSTLRLSKSDVAGITGPKTSSRGGRGGARGGRGRGRGGKR